MPEIHGGPEELRETIMETWFHAKLTTKSWQMQDWLQSKCHGRFFLRPGMISFELESDWTLYLLSWD